MKLLSLNILTLLANVAACSDPWLTVQITGTLPLEAERLRLSAILEDSPQEYSDEFLIERDQVSITFHIPRQEGKLRLVATSIDKDDCRTKVISKSFQLNGNRFGQEVALDLSDTKSLAPIRCHCTNGWCSAKEMVPSVYALQKWLTVWGSSNQNIIIAGAGAKALTWDGMQWSSADIASRTEDIRKVWSRNADGILAALGANNGNGYVYKRSSGNWTSIRDLSMDLRGIWQGTSENIWVSGRCGTYGCIADAFGNSGRGREGQSGEWTHFGELPRDVPGIPSALHSVWGADDKDIWAVGDSGAVYHWQGSEWQRENTQTFGNYELRSVWGFASDNVWIVGTRGAIFQWDGLSWKQKNIQTNSSLNLNAIWGDAYNNIWAVGEQGAILRYNGMDWTKQSSSNPANLFAVWGVGPDDVWIVGDSGTVLFRDP